METMHIENPQLLSGVVDRVLNWVSERDNDTAAVVALSGDLGAGKTTFVQTLARTLTIQQTVTSPTYVIMKQYVIPTGPDQSLGQLVHIDAYRIEDVDEMRVLGFASLLGQKDTIICIEWAERIAPLLPADTLHVQFTIEGTARDVTIA